MRLDDRDRGRLLLAIVVTLVALPTVWLANRRADDAPRPDVSAAAGAGTEVDDGFDPMGEPGAAYIEANPTPTAAPPPRVVVGTTPDELVATTFGTYRHEVAWDRCLYNGVGLGEEVTVVNVANGRSTTCTTSYLPGGGDEVVLNTERFRRIAALVNAPIHVEIRQ